ADQRCGVSSPQGSVGVGSIAMRAIIGAAIIALWSASGAAQDLPHLTKLAPNVYAYEQVDPTKRGVTANNLIVITSDGVLVADGQGTPENVTRLVVFWRSWWRMRSPTIARRSNA